MCGKPIDGNSEFCTYCGENQNPSVSTSMRNQKPMVYPSNVKQSKKQSKVVSIFVGCILALAVLGGAAYYWFEIREDYSLEELAKITTGEYELYDFHDGYAAIKKDNKLGVINKKGEIIALPIYYPSNNFDNGGYSCYAVMSEDRMLLRKEIDGIIKSGYIDKNGKVIIPFIYDAFADNFSDGLALVKKNGKCGFIDKDGNVVIPFIYDGATSFSNGLASVTKNQRKPGCMYINKKGKVVLSLKDYWCYTGTFSDEGLALINKDGKWGLMDESGKIITDCMYDEVEGFAEGYYQVIKDGKAGFVDKKGKEIIPCNFYATFAFKDGFAKVCVDWDAGKWSLIDTDGNIIIPEVKDIGDYFEGVAVAKRNDRFGYVDKSGNEVIPFVFESASHFSEGFARVKIKGMCGYIDKNGDEAIPFIYEDAYDFSESLARVKKNGMWGYVDKEGKSTFDYQ